MSSSPSNSQSNNDYSKENSKKDKKSFGQKAKDSAEKRENKLLSSNPNINNPNRNGDFVEKKQVVVQHQENRKDKKSSKHWNDKLIQQEIQVYDDSVEDAARAAAEEEEEEFLEYAAAAALEEEEEEEDRSQGPPPIDPEELERMNEHCFQFAMDLRQRNDDELRGFVFKKLLSKAYDGHFNITIMEENDYKRNLKNQNLLDEAEIERIKERISERKLLIEEEEDDDDSMASLITISDDDDDDMPGLEVCDDRGDADSRNVYML